MRHLASIQRILSINPIPNADAIEVAQINGWRVVVKKGDFQVGDLVIYLEIDSWIPTAIAPFLSKGKEPSVYDGISGERLRTVRLRGQVSQGLILPLSVLGRPAEYCGFNEDSIDTDVTADLGIIKYDPPIPACLAGLVKGAWPSRIPKTDEVRIQNLTAEWDELRKLDYEVTEKLEGASMTVAIIDDEFIVCSRNLNLKENESNTFWKVARSQQFEEKLRKFIGNSRAHIALQGELVGPGIEGNHYQLTSHDFYLYNILCLNKEAIELMSKLVQST